MSPGVQTPAFNQRAIRSGNWKLIRDSGRTMLFDLSKDISERNDVAAHHVDVTRRLHLQLVAWEKDVDSEARSRAAAGSGVDPEAAYFVRANRMLDPASGQYVGPVAVQIFGDRIAALLTGDAARQLQVIDVELGPLTLLPGGSGRIAVGAAADIIAVTGDPAREGSSLSQPAFVMRNGKIVRQP